MTDLSESTINIGRQVIREQLLGIDDRISLYVFCINPPTNSGPTYYCVTAPSEQSACSAVLKVCHPTHRLYVIDARPEVLDAGIVKII